MVSATRFAAAVVRGSLHSNRDDLGDPFSVATNHESQFLCCISQESLEVSIGLGALLNRSVFGKAIRQTENRVVRAGITVHRNAVEGLIDCRSQRLLEGGWSNRCIGRQIGQHGGHIGMDHARTFGHAADGDDATADSRLYSRRFLAASPWLESLARRDRLLEC